MTCLPISRVYGQFSVTSQSLQFLDSIISWTTSSVNRILVPNQWAMNWAEPRRSRMQWNKWSHSHPLHFPTWAEYWYGDTARVGEAGALDQFTNLFTPFVSHYFDDEQIDIYGNQVLRVETKVPADLCPPFILWAWHITFCRHFNPFIFSLYKINNEL